MHTIFFSSSSCRNSKETEKDGSGKRYLQFACEERSPIYYSINKLKRTFLSVLPGWRRPQKLLSAWSAEIGTPFNLHHTGKNVKKRIIYKDLIHAHGRRRRRKQKLASICQSRDRTVEQVLHTHTNVKTNEYPKQFDKKKAELVLILSASYCSYMKTKFKQYTSNSPKAFSLSRICFIGAEDSYKEKNKKKHRIAP